MRSFQDILLLFENHLKEAMPFPGYHDNLYEPCRYLLAAGGKRIRPALCLMAAEMFGGINEDVFHAALTVELFHNFTLIHDDIMDKAPLRRGKPTVHAKYGLTAGILSGDIMGIYAYQCLGRVSPQHLPGIFAIFNKTAIEVCEGQQWDMDFENQDKVTIDEYLKMITLKTSVLLAASLQMGALLAGAPEEEAHKLYEFGKYMGIAFQLQDDYLDTFGSEEKIGKKPGGDIRANKKTFLMLKSKELATQPLQLQMETALAMPEDDRVEQVRSLFLELDVDKHSRDIITEYSDRSFAFLDDIRLPEERKAELRSLAAWLLNRQH